MIRRRGTILILTAVVALLTIELGLRISARPRAVVEVVNHGSADVVGLRILADGDEVAIDRIPPNGSGFATVSGRGRCRIRLSFSQAGSALSAVQFDDFDPAALISAREKYVVDLSDSGYRQVREDLGDADEGFLGRLGGALRRAWDGTP